VKTGSALHHVELAVHDLTKLAGRSALLHVARNLKRLLLENKQGS
jgi:hypothetical protein